MPARRGNICSWAKCRLSEEPEGLSRSAALGAMLSSPDCRPHYSLFQGDYLWLCPWNLVSTATRSCWQNIPFKPEMGQFWVVIVVCGVGRSASYLCVCEWLQDSIGLLTPQCSWGVSRGGGCLSASVWRSSPLWDVAVARSWLLSPSSCGMLSLVPAPKWNVWRKEMGGRACGSLCGRSWALVLILYCVVTSSPALGRAEWQRGCTPTTHRGWFAARGSPALGWTTVPGLCSHQGRLRAAWRSSPGHACSSVCFVLLCGMFCLVKTLSYIYLKCITLILGMMNGSARAGIDLYTVSGKDLANGAAVGCHRMVAAARNRNNVYAGVGLFKSESV